MAVGQLTLQLELGLEVLLELGSLVEQSLVVILLFQSGLVQQQAQVLVQEQLLVVLVLVWLFVS